MSCGETITFPTNTMRICSAGKSLVPNRVQSGHCNCDLGLVEREVTNWQGSAAIKWT
jgi:hypothetical protein